MNDFYFKQRGATLIVCLIILVVITILGVGGVQDSLLEEKMAGNMKDRNLAFQAAEAALRDGEEYLVTTSILPNFDGTTAGLYAQLDSSGTPPMKWSEATWDANGVAYSGTIADVYAAPRYIIEKLDSTIPSPSLQAGVPQNNHTFYRITAKGNGSSDKAVVVLRSMYKR